MFCQECQPLLEQQLRALLERCNTALTSDDVDLTLTVIALLTMVTKAQGKKPDAELLRVQAINRVEDALRPSVPKKGAAKQGKAVTHVDAAPAKKPAAAAKKPAAPVRSCRSCCATECVSVHMF